MARFSLLVIPRFASIFQLHRPLLPRTRPKMHRKQLTKQRFHSVIIYHN